MKNIQHFPANEMTAQHTGTTASAQHTTIADNTSNTAKKADTNSSVTKVNTANTANTATKANINNTTMKANINSTTMKANINSTTMKANTINTATKANTVSSATKANTVNTATKANTNNSVTKANTVNTATKTPEEAGHQSDTAGACRELSRLALLLSGEQAAQLVGIARMFLGMPIGEPVDDKPLRNKDIGSSHQPASPTGNGDDATKGAVTDRHAENNTGNGGQMGVSNGGQTGVSDGGELLGGTVVDANNRLVYGIKGIAAIFGCSTRTASRIKMSGIIDGAYRQFGHTIVVNVERALRLIGAHHDCLNEVLDGGQAVGRQSDTPSLNGKTQNDKNISEKNSDNDVSNMPLASKASNVAAVQTPMNTKLSEVSTAPTLQGQNATQTSQYQKTIPISQSQRTTQAAHEQETSQVSQSKRTTQAAHDQETSQVSQSKRTTQAAQDQETSQVSQSKRTTQAAQEQRTTKRSAGKVTSVSAKRGSAEQESGNLFSLSSFSLNNNILLNNKESVKEKEEKESRTSLSSGVRMQQQAPAPSNSNMMQKQNAPASPVQRQATATRSRTAAFDVHQAMAEVVAPPYREAFGRWIDYKDEMRQQYKSVTTLRVCYERLVQLAGHDPARALAIVDQSIVAGWRGLFPLHRGVSGGPETVRPDEIGVVLRNDSYDKFKDVKGW